MKYLIVGLGNPGPKYDRTRHNVGFLFADFIVDKYNQSFDKKMFGKYYISKLIISDDIFYIVKPQTFMNKSGEVFNKIYRATGVEKDKTIVVVDNMDLEIGLSRLKFGGGTAGHNGLKSIVSYIGNSFYRLYLGVGRPNEHSNVVSHVLGKLSNSELDILENVNTKCCNSLLSFSEKGKNRVINEINTK